MQSVRFVRDRRSTPSRLVVAALVALAAGVATPGWAPAKTFTIDASTDAKFPDGNDGDCTLREALVNAAQNANNTPTTYADCPAGDPDPTVDVINFSVNNVTLAQDADEIFVTSNLGSGPVEINGNVTLDGGGQARSKRIFRTVGDSDHTVKFVGLTFQNAWDGGGGAILNLGTSLIFQGVLFQDNKAISSAGGAINSSGGDAIFMDGVTFDQNESQTQDGGAIWLSGSSSQITLKNVTFSNNKAALSGGAAYFTGSGTTGAFWLLDTVQFTDNESLNGTANNGAHQLGGGGAIFNNIDYDETTIFKNCTFDGNKATEGKGGAIYNSIGAQNIEIQDSVFTLNFATNVDPTNVTDQGFGGAIWNQGQLTLNRVTLEGNTAVLHGGGLGNKSSSGNNSTVANSTITGNIVSTASSEGGGIWNDSSSTLVTRNTTVADNFALLGSGANLYNKGELVALNTIFANTLGSSNCAGPSKLTNANGDGNVQWPGTSCDALPDAIASGDPKLAAGIPAGGPAGSKVFPIGAGSAATSFGNATVCSDPPVSGVDQTNASRPQPNGTSCDSGAYESNRAAGYGSNPAPGQTVQIDTDTSTTGNGKVTVSETGTDDLHVTDVQLTGDAEITLTSAQSFDIADGGPDVDITFDCASNTADAYTATLQVTHNGGNSPSSYTITCNVSDNSAPGYGSTPTAGTTIILATTFGVDATENVVISETGDATLTGTVSLIAAPLVSSIELTQGDGPFVINDGGASVTVGIKCSGTSDTQDAALLSVTHNANGSPALYPIACIIEGPNTPIYESLPIPGSTIDIVTPPNVAATVDVYVENLGNADLEVSNIQLSGDANLTLVSPSSFTLASKRPPEIVTVQCVSSNSGNYSTSVSVSHNAPGSPASYTVNCNVTGNAIPGYGSSPVKGSTVQMGVVVGGSASTSVDVSETGSATLTVDNVGLLGDAEISLTSPSSFSIVDGGPPQSIDLECSSAYIGTYHATLSVSHDANGSPAEYNVVCNVTATASPVYTSSPLPGGGLALSTSTGSPTSGSIAVAEGGTAQLDVTDVALSGDPEITLTTPTSFSIVDGGPSQNVTAQCTSAQAGQFSSTLTVTHNAPGSPATYTIDCNVTQGAAPGYGSNPVSGSSLPIAATTGTPATTDVIVSETGTALLDVTNVAVSGDAELSLTTASSFQIADGGLDQTVTVQCSSNQAGQYTGTLTVTHNAAGSPAIYPITCDVSAPAPGYGSSPTPGSTLTLGTTAGTPTTTDVVVSETGAALLDVTNVAVTGDAPLTLTTASSFQIADGGSGQTVTVQCSSAQVGQYTGTLTITHNASGSPATYPIQCNVTAVPTPGYGSNPTPGSSLPLATTVNVPTSTNVTVSETGSATLNVTNVAVSGDPEITLTTAGSFQIADGGNDQTITVQCSASQTGQYTATLTVTHNAAGSPATYPITCDVGAAPAPGFDSNPAPGNTLVLSSTVGVATSTNVAVSENGTATLSVSNVEVTGSAALSLTSASSFQIVDGGASQDVSVQCTSAQAGQFNGTLTITHNANGSPATYPIQCNVTQAPAPGFGSNPPAGNTLVLGTTPNVAATTDVVVSETGTATLSVSSVAVSGSAALSRTTAASFQIVDGGPSQTVTVQCLSAQIGQYAGTLTVTHDANGSPATYPIQCNVTAAPTPAYASSPTPGTLIPLITTPGVTASDAIAVSEAGSATLVVSNVAVSGDPEITLTSAGSFQIPDGGASQDITFQCTSASAGSFASTLTVTHNGAGSPAQYAITCSVNVPPQGAVEGDFDADGKPDMMWEDPSNGSLLLWFMNGTQRLGFRALSPSKAPGATWHVKGSGDFNGDGRTDLLFQDATTGAMKVWFMKGYKRVGEADVTPANVANPLLEVVAVGDFNNDGKPDVLRQQYGKMPMNVVFLNGASAVGQVTFNPEKATTTKSRTLGAPDMNGDGKPDILFALKGKLSVWFMDGTTRIGTATLTPANAATSKDVVVGSADYDGDGNVDLLFQNKQTRLLTLWFMNGVNRLSSSATSPAKEANASWTVVAPR